MHPRILTDLVLHLGAAPVERLERTIEELDRLGPRRLVPIHCTGDQAAARILGALPGRSAVGRTGDTVVA
jgi:metal-dependent hydrolase (beta-lactamase superfamily II)